MIRVLHVIGRMDRGGAETLLLNLHRAIDTSRIQFDYLVHTPECGDYDEEIAQLGGKIYHIPTFKGYNISSYRLACKSFLDVHQEHSIVHGHIGSSAPLYLSAAHELGRFTIAHSHSRHFPLTPNELVFRTLSYPTRFIADYYFGCSKQAGIDRYGKKVVRSTRFKVLKNGINLNQFQYDGSLRSHTRYELGIRDDVFAIAHVGRLTSVKNHPFLFDCFRAILAEKPFSDLFLIGTGEERENLVKLSKEMHIDRKVHFLGTRNDIPTLLMGMDAFIFPSKSEGLPLACVEAQASGLPCFISSGVSEEVLFSPLAEFLPLSIGPDEWAHNVLSKDKPDSNARQKCVLYARDAGYDITSTASYLANFYEQIATR